jgi:PAS domain-containing protein
MQIYAAIRDISMREHVKALQDEVKEHSKTAQKLKVAYQEHTDITNAIPNVLIKLDIDARISWWNLALETLTGHNASDLSEKSVYTFLSKSDKTRLEH